MNTGHVDDEGASESMGSFATRFETDIRTTSSTSLHSAGNSKIWMPGWNLYLSPSECEGCSSIAPRGRLVSEQQIDVVRDG